MAKLHELSDLNGEVEILFYCPFIFNTNSTYLEDEDYHHKFSWPFHSVSGNGWRKNENKSRTANVDHVDY